MRPLPLALAALLVVAGFALPAAPVPTTGSPSASALGAEGSLASATTPALSGSIPSERATDTRTHSQSTQERTRDDPPSRPVVDSLPGTTSYLAISDDAIQTARIDVVTLDVGGAVATGEASLSGQFQIEQFHTRLSNAENERAVATATLDDIVARTAELRARQTSVTQAYNRGELDTRTYLRELAIVGAEAEELRVVASIIIDRGTEFGLGSTVESDARRVRADLDALHGPVRPLVAAALAGEQDAPDRFYVETSAEGVVLATLDDGVYYREAYLDGVRTNTASDGGFTGFSDALDTVLNEFYPWAFGSPPTGVNSGGGNATEEGVYRFIFPHEQGMLTAFVSRDAGEVFAEFQTKRVADAPVEFTTPGEDDGLRVEVGLTHPGGQLLVRTTESSTETPIDAVVYVNGERIGRTGENGERYTLTPRGQVNTTVVAGDDRVIVQTGDRPA